MSNWYDDPTIAEALAEPVEPYLDNLAAHNDRLFAALHDERGPLVVLDYEGIDAFIASRDAEFDMDPEAA